MRGLGFDVLSGALLVICYFGKYIFGHNMTAHTFGERHYIERDTHSRCIYPSRRIYDNVN